MGDDPMRRSFLAGAAACIGLILGGCGEEDKPSPTFTLPCMGQIASSVEQCAQIMAAEMQRQNQELDRFRIELELQGYETGFTTIGELIQQHSATINQSGQTLAEMIAQGRATHEQAKELFQTPQMTNTVSGQEALAAFNERYAAIIQGQNEPLQRQRAEDEAAFRALEARREQQRIEEIDRLQSDLQDKIHDDQVYQDDLSEAALDSAEWAEQWGP